MAMKIRRRRVASGRNLACIDFLRGAIMRFFTVVAVLFLAACNRSHEDSHTPAYEAGRAAREVAKESAKAAKAAGRELKNGAREAHEGWKDQSREDRAKGKP
jgi:hypothetical protein